jgi:hypothetical protein
MWINLEDAEISAIVAAVGDGAIANKLLARPSAGTGAFVAAAEKKTKKRISVEEEGVIDRRVLGAYVMCWMWISERDAGLPMSFEPFFLSDASVRVLRAIPSFHVEDLKRNDRRFIVEGRFGDHSWTFVAFSKMWWVHFNRSGTTEWLHSEKWLGVSEDYEMSDEEALLSVATAITRASPGLNDRRTLRHSLTWRRQLDQYVFGEISGEVAKGFLDSTLSRVEADADRHRLSMLDLDPSGKSFWGPVYFDEWSLVNQSAAPL